MVNSSDPPPAWHALPAEQTFHELKSSDEGLSAAEARTRLLAHGPNLIERGSRRSALKILLHQLADPLVYVLIAAGLIAALMGKLTDGAVVLAVVVINTWVGFVQEMRASKAIEALSRLMPQQATVARDGDATAISAQELVPGDVLLLQPGDQISADVRLFEVNGLQVEESMLTGESVPAGKHEVPVPADAVLGDRRSMAFGGTLVVAGTAKGVVTATGADTELGRISRLLNETVELETPLTRRLGRLARAITLGIVTVAGLIFLVGLLRDYPLLDSAMAAITLAVASIPEGLPAVITIASAIGVRRMARRKAIIRHLPAVETLGSTTVICTDKTGTLTRNEMTVEALWTPAGTIAVTGTGYAPEGELRENGDPTPAASAAATELLRAAVLCSDAMLENDDGRWKIVGDPTEGALVVAARKAQLDEDALREAHERLDEIPFDSERQFMATLHATAEGGQLVCVKGAPEVVARLCPAIDGQPPVEAVNQAAQVLAERGMRVLGVAMARIEAIQSLDDAAWRHELRLLGLAGMVDPPREEALDAVRACQRAGVVVKMVTGDHPATARAIGLLFGLLDSEGEGAQVVSGRQIEAASDSELMALADSTNVFARVAPEHKLRLVQALQADGHVVAMTGDGVNDAPALKRAEIGVAMGISGTAVAREASDMVLADDNFASISAAVEEGRRVYDNLLKSLAFILPTSLGQAMVILVAVLFFPMVEGRLLMPIEPVQILWVNLVVAIALALPLAFEVHEPGLMERPPRPPNEPLLGPLLIFRTFLVGALMTAGAVGLFLYEYHADLAAGIAPEIALAESQTVAVTTIILFQCAYLLNCRSLTESAFRIGLFSNPYVYFGIAATLVLQLCFVYVPPLNVLFHTHPLDARDWVAPALVALACLPVLSLEKRFWRWHGQSVRDAAAGEAVSTTPMNDPDPVERHQPPASPAASVWFERGLSDLAFLALTVLILLLCFLIARPFFTSLAWATALAVIAWPLHRWIIQRVPWPNASASLSLIGIALLLFVPSSLVIPSAIDEAFSGYRLIRAQIESGSWDDMIARHSWIAPTWEWLRQRLDLGDALQRAGEMLTVIGSFAVKASFVGTIEFVLTLFFLYYFLRDGSALLAGIRGLLPLSPKESERIFRVVGDTIFATVYGKVLVGIVQGALGGLMFWWLDLPAAWFWAIMMGVLSIIPILGPPLVWVPAALILLLDGAWGQGLLLLIWGTAVVGLADNLLYPIVVGKYLRLHTVPLLVALIGGVVVFGAVGFFVGPVVLAVTYAALEIWRARAEPG